MTLQRGEYIVSLWLANCNVAEQEHLVLQRLTAEMFAYA